MDLQHPGAGGGIVNIHDDGFNVAVVHVLLLVGELL